MAKTADEVFRDFVRYTGDGLPNEPINAPLPWGDARSGVWNPPKFDIRDAFRGVYEARDEAEQWAEVALSVAGSGTIYATRAALAAAVTAGTYPDGAICYVQGRRYRVDPIGPDRLVMIDGDWSGRLDMLRAKMADGAALRLACYGDSTTEGQQTTGAPAPNATDGSGNATGNAAYVAPNAWPAVAQTILRRMYGNNAIQFWNAGYGGKEILTGWARRNFAGAMVNKSAYGTPDACFIAFGANDIVNEAFTPDLFLSEFSLLLNLCDYYGVVPIIVTPDPMSWYPRQGGKIAKLVSVLEQVSQQFGIEVLDFHNALTDVYSSSGTNRLWVPDQPDAIHFQDNGHRVKAAYAAARMFSKTLWLDEVDNLNIAPWSRYANTQGITYNVYAEANNRFGASANVLANTYTAGQTLMEVWIWTKSTAMDAYWRSVSGDGYFYPSALDSAPEIEVGEYFTGAVIALKSPTAGQVQQPSPNRDAEAPTFVRSLKAGLTRLTFKAPSDNASRVVFLGYFCIRQNHISVTKATFWEGGGTGGVVRDPGIFDERSLLVGSGFTRTTRLTIDVAMPDGSGVMLYSGRVFADGSGGANQRQMSILLFRNGANVQLWEIASNNTGVLGTNQLATAAYTWDEQRNEFMIRLGVNGSNQYYIQVTPATSPNSPLITLTRARTEAPWCLGGHFGGFYKAYGVSGAAGRARCTVLEYEVN